MQSLALLPATLIAFALPSAANATVERIALPFMCRVEAGKVRLTPSRERHYPIFGRSAPVAVTACEDGSTAQCRTLQTYRFRMACGQKQVSWSDVALAIGGRRTSKVWASNGRMHLLVLRPGVNGRACADGGGDEIATSALDGRCASAHQAQFAMAPGYAPLELFGARLLQPSEVPFAAEADSTITGSLETEAAVGATEPKPPATAGEKAGPAAAPSGLPNDAQRRVRSLRDRIILTEPLPDVEDLARSRVLADASGAAQTWLTTIRRSDEASVAVHAGSSSFSAELLVWAMLTTLFAAAGWTAWTRQQVLAEKIAAGVGEGRLWRSLATLAERFRTSPQLGNQAADGVFPVASISAALRETERMVALLPESSPLRRVIDDELQRCCQRFSVAKAAAADAAGPGQINATAFRVIMRDIDRIRRIAEGAHASGDSASSADRMPASSAEAYEVLGVNARASEATIKKVTDALRMSWHPDLAQDDDDRLQREQRIKQINAAFDIVSGQRSAVSVG